MNKSHSCDNEAQDRQNYYSGLRMVGVVPHSFENKAISAPSWARAWAWAELGNIRIMNDCSIQNSTISKAELVTYMKYSFAKPR